MLKEQLFFDVDSIKLSEEEDVMILVEYNKNRDELIAKTREDHFSNHINLSYHEQNAERKLYKLRD